MGEEPVFIDFLHHVSAEAIGPRATVVGPGSRGRPADLGDSDVSLCQTRKGKQKPSR